MAQEATGHKASAQDRNNFGIGQSVGKKPWTDIWMVGIEVIGRCTSIAGKPRPKTQKRSERKSAISGYWHQQG